MRKGYKYMGVIWPSIEDCLEISLSLYQEKIYIYAMRCLNHGVTDWMERANNLTDTLKKFPSSRKWKVQEFLIMD